MIADFSCVSLEMRHKIARGGLRGSLFRVYISPSLRRSLQVRLRLPHVSFRFLYQCRGQALL